MTEFIVKPPFLLSFYVWEIMHATIKKMNKHVAKLQKEVEDAKDRLEAAQRKVNKLRLSSWCIWYQNILSLVVFYP